MDDRAKAIAEAMFPNDTKRRELASAAISAYGDEREREAINSVHHCEDTVHCNTCEAVYDATHE